MKDTKKSTAGNKRRKKRNGQVRLQAQQLAQKGSSGCLSAENSGKLCEPTQPPFPGAMKTQPDEQERIRKLWERKQRELETRWAAAQAHQAGQETRRKRAIKIGYSITAVVLVMLLCTVVWFAV